MEESQHRNQGLSGTDAEEAEFEVDRVSPTKKPGSVIANARVRLGPVRVMFKVIRGKRGLFTVPPASPYTSWTGRPCYALRFKFLDPALRDEVEESVLQALHVRLAMDGRHVPDLTFGRATADALA